MFSTDAPKIKLPSSPFLMEVGLANQVDCTIERGHPKPSIKWTKKGESDVVLSEIDSLMFANPTEADQAVYCVEVCILSISGFLVIIIKYVTLCLKRWKMWRVLKGRRSVWKSKVVLWMSKTFFSSFPLQIQFCGCQKPFSSFPLQIQSPAMRRGSKRRLTEVSFQISLKVRTFPLLQRKYYFRQS